MSGSMALDTWRHMVGAIGTDMIDGMFSPVSYPTSRPNRAQRRRKLGRYVSTKAKCRELAKKLKVAGPGKKPRIGGKYLTGYYSFLLQLEKSRRAN